jgi:transposase
MCLSYNHFIISLNHHTEQQLKTLSNKVKDHRMRMRLLAVAHFKAGKNKADVAITSIVSRRTANEWVANYFKGGVSALESKNHREDPLYCAPSKKPS